MTKEDYDIILVKCKCILQNASASNHKEVTDHLLAILLMHLFCIVLYIPIIF